MDLTFLAAIGSVFLASLLGSGHCAAMCGGFLYVVSGQRGGSIASTVAYHFGRLQSYLGVGLLAGYFGSFISDAGIILGIQRAAMVVTGVILLIWGGLGLISSNLRPFKGFAKLISRFSFGLHGELLSGLGRSTLTQPFLFGLSSTLLPCGWLYAFAALAAGTGSTLGGGLLMFSFWLGTLPVLTLFALAGGQFTARLNRIFPKIGYLLILCAGIFSILSHTNLINLHLHSHAIHKHE